MKKIFLLICFTFLTSYAFSYNNIDPGTIIKCYYEETQCDDPWGTAPTLDERIAKVEAYLTEQKIRWRSIQIKQEIDFRPFCQGCDCETGYTFFVTIEEKFLEKIEEIGFKRVLKK